VHSIKKAKKPMNKFNILFLILLISCNNKKEETNALKGKNDSLKIEVKSQQSNQIVQSADTVKIGDTLRINYKENKEILEILKLLPNKSMGSWEWPKSERDEMIKSISKNNYFIDKTPNYNNIKYIKTNTIGIQVVDGFWKMSIYKIALNNYIVITDDIVGDGNDLISFEYKNGNLTEIEFNSLFDGLQKNLLKNTDEKDCAELLEDNLLTFTYDFKEKQNITINSWLLNKDENENCFKGNTLNYKFNPEFKKFTLESVIWKAKEE
jgi:ribosomal 50S subunit-recycling heat shock protein